MITNPKNLFTPITKILDQYQQTHQLDATANVFLQLEQLLGQTQLKSTELIAAISSLSQKYYNQLDTEGRNIFSYMVDINLADTYNIIRTNLLQIPETERSAQKQELATHGFLVDFSANDIIVSFIPELITQTNEQRDHALTAHYATIQKIIFRSRIQITESGGNPELNSPAAHKILTQIDNIYHENTKIDRELKQRINELLDQYLELIKIDSSQMPSHAELKKDFDNPIIYLNERLQELFTANNATSAYFEVKIGTHLNLNDEYFIISDINAAGVSIKSYDNKYDPITIPVNNFIIAFEKLTPTQITIDDIKKKLAKTKQEQKDKKSVEETLYAQKEDSIIPIATSKMMPLGGLIITGKSLWERVTNYIKDKQELMTARTAYDQLKGYPSVHHIFADRYTSLLTKRVNYIKEDILGTLVGGQIINRYHTFMAENGPNIHKDVFLLAEYLALIDKMASIGRLQSNKLLGDIQKYNLGNGRFAGYKLNGAGSIGTVLPALGVPSKLTNKMFVIVNQGYRDEMKNAQDKANSFPTAQESLKDVILNIGNNSADVAGQIATFLSRKNSSTYPNIVAMQILLSLEGGFSKAEGGIDPQYRYLYESAWTRELNVLSFKYPYPMLRMIATSTNRRTMIKHLKKLMHDMDITKTIGSGITTQITPEKMVAFDRLARVIGGEIDQQTGTSLWDNDYNDLRKDLVNITGGEDTDLDTDFLGNPSGFIFTGAQNYIMILQLNNSNFRYPDKPKALFNYTNKIYKNLLQTNKSAAANMRQELIAKLKTVYETVNNHDDREALLINIEEMTSGINTLNIKVNEIKIAIGSNINTSSAGKEE